MTKEEAIKYLQQIYTNGGHCWLDEQRIKAISMAIDALKEEPVSEIDFEQELYKAFGQVKDFTLGMRIAKRFYEMGRNHQEHVSNDFEMALAEMICKAQTSVVEPLVVAAQWKDELIKLAKSEESVSRTPADIEAAMQEVEEKSRAFTEAHHGEDADTILAQMRGEEPISEEFEKKFISFVDATHDNNGSYSLHDFAQRLYNIAKEELKEPVSKDLGECISELSKQFPEVSFAKLSRIAVRVAKWQKQQDQSIIELAEDHAYFAGRTKTIDEIKEALLSEVLPCFMHGGEADEVVAKLEEVLNKKK